MTDKLHTPTPWNWNIYDYSDATLEGRKGSDGGDHVLSVSPCNSCLQKTEREDNPQWKWGRCITPTQPNADFIIRAVNSHAAMVDALESITRPYDGWDEVQLRLRVKSDEHFKAIIDARAALELAKGE